MEGIIDFHHDVMYLLIWVVVAVMWVVFELVEKDSYIMMKKKVSIKASTVQRHTVLEII
jgi:hypothetical protein